MHQNPTDKTSPPMYQPVNITTISSVGSQPQRVAPMMTQTIPPATLGMPRNTTKTMPPWLPEKGSPRVSFMCSVVYILSTLAGGYLTYLSSGPFPAVYSKSTSSPKPRQCADEDGSLGRMKTQYRFGLTGIYRSSWLSSSADHPSTSWSIWTTCSRSAHRAPSVGSAVSQLLPGSSISSSAWVMR